MFRETVTQVMGSGKAKVYKNGKETDGVWSTVDIAHKFLDKTASFMKHRAFVMHMGHAGS